MYTRGDATTMHCNRESTIELYEPLTLGDLEVGQRFRFKSGHPAGRERTVGAKGQLVNGQPFVVTVYDDKFMAIWADHSLNEPVEVIND